MARCTSIEYVGSQVDDAVSALLRQLQGLGAKPSTGLVFLAGTLARQVLPLCKELARHLGEVPCLVACSTAVLSDRREHEQVSAMSALFWTDSRCVAFGFNVQDAEEESPVARIAALLRRTDFSVHSLGLFVSKEAFLDFSILNDVEKLGVPAVFGGAAVGEPAVVLVRDGAVKAVDLAGIALGGGMRPVVKSFGACKVLGEPESVTEVEEGVVVRIGEESALSVLKRQAKGASSRRLIVAAIALKPENAAHPTFLVRPIRGIHETREGVMIGPDAPLGARVAFAVIDPAQARLDIDTSLRELGRELAGSAPLFGIYVDCTGRGSALYSVPDVDIERIRSRFPHVPIAGMKSAFEIGPGDSASRVHLYTGVLSVFRSPS